MIFIEKSKQKKRGFRNCGISSHIYPQFNSGRSFFRSIIVFGLVWHFDYYSRLYLQKDKKRQFFFWLGRYSRTHSNFKDHFDGSFHIKDHENHLNIKIRWCCRYVCTPNLFMFHLPPKHRRKKKLSKVKAIKSVIIVSFIQPKKIPKTRNQHATGT